MEESKTEKEASESIQGYIEKHGILKILNTKKKSGNTRKYEKLLKENTEKTGNRITMIRFKDSKVSVFEKEKDDCLKIFLSRNKIEYETKIYDDLILNFDKSNKLVLVEILKASEKFKN